MRSLGPPTRRAFFVRHDRSPASPASRIASTSFQSAVLPPPRRPAEDASGQRILPNDESTASSHTGQGNRKAAFPKAILRHVGIPHSDVSSTTMPMLINIPPNVARSCATKGTRCGFALKSCSLVVHRNSISSATKTLVIPIEQITVPAPISVAP